MLNGKQGSREGSRGSGREAGDQGGKQGIREGRREVLSPGGAFKRESLRHGAHWHQEDVLVDLFRRQVPAARLHDGTKGAGDTVDRGDVYRANAAQLLDRLTSSLRE